MKLLKNILVKNVSEISVSQNEVIEVIKDFLSCYLLNLLCYCFCLLCLVDIYDALPSNLVCSYCVVSIVQFEGKYHTQAPGTKGFVELE